MTALAARGCVLGSAHGWCNRRSVSVSLDPTGPKCPLVPKARRQIGQMTSGILEVKVDDPAAPLDFEHFCDTAGVTFFWATPRTVSSFHIRVDG